MGKLQKLGAPHESEECANQLLQTPPRQAKKILISCRLRAGSSTLRDGQRVCVVAAQSILKREVQPRKQTNMTS